MTIFSSYLLFYTAEETVVKVSGILSLVTMGLYMSRKGKTWISTSSHEFIHNVWTYLTFFAETMIFLFAGYVISSRVLQFNTIQIKDYFLCIVLFIFLHLIRFFSILLFWPIINRIGYGLNWREMIVLGYGGLRGALALVLALILSADNRVNENVRHYVLFYTCGVALLTILINGNTTGLLLKKLGL